MNLVSKRDSKFLLIGFLLGIATFLLFVLGLTFWSDYQENQAATKQVIAELKCPYDYGSDKFGIARYKNDIDRWTDAYVANYPDAPVEDRADARIQYYINLNCDYDKLVEWLDQHILTSENL